MSCEKQIVPVGKLIVWVVIFLSGFTYRMYGDVVLGEIDWNTPETSEDFSHHPVATVVDYPATGGNPADGGWMRIEFPTIPDNPGRMWYDVLSMPATNLFAGTWTTNMWLQFDFWESNLVAGAVQLRWQSATNSSVWRASLTPPSSLQTWTTLAQSFMNWEDWRYPGATEAQYLSDLQNVDWVGVYIFRNTIDEQIYGIDNFIIMIPEPAECFMLMVAVITSGISFRKKRRKKRAC
ncbi:MAG: hypothetical protein PHR77_03150 [Kiritimatiellae bacterium]|nr:hypothetical protein [Kiritimatiellia bacterium]MDD5520358.1 hypothetical protein [Kiritimatiellia bacterium]